MRKTLTLLLLLVANAAQAATLPFTHSNSPLGGVVVTSTTSGNQGNIEVGDRVIAATRIKGQISAVRSSGELNLFAEESVPARMIFLHIIKQSNGQREIRVAPLMR